MIRAARGQTFLALFVSGSLFPLALAPFYYWPIVIASMAVLFRLLQRQSPKQAFIKSAVFGFGMFFAGVSWVYVSIHDHGFIAAPLALLATTLFCLFIALLFALPFTLSALIPQTPTAWLLGLPALWVLSEWFRSWALTGFPWLYSGYIHTETWLSGWAPLGGVFWLSFITALAAVTVAQLSQTQRSQASVKFSAILVALITVSGYLLKNIHWTQAHSESLSAVLVQPNIDQNKKWSAGELDRILQQLQTQTEPHWGADLIVWPEAAVPTTPQRAADLLTAIDRAGKVNQTALLTGIPTYERSSGKYFNSVLALGTAQGQYDKTRLVPFGEYVPLESILRGLIRFLDLPMSSFSLGASEQPPLIVAGATIATAICYEIVYPDLVAEMAENANILLTVSNDAWFGQSIAPRQHMQMARMRAIENSKPMLRGTTNGVTAIIDHQGNIVAQLAQFTAGELSGEITPRSGRTFFSHTGSWPIVVLSLLLSCGLIAQRRYGETNNEKRH